MNKNTNTEPFLRITKKVKAPVWQQILVRVIALALAAVLTLLLVRWLGEYSFGDTVKAMWKGSFGVKISTESFFKEAALLLLFALALAPAFKMRFWNIGAQGQVLVGALMSAMFMFYLGNKLPNAAILPLMFVCSVLTGALWAFIPAVFRAFFGTNETLFTLMMNYIAIQIVACFTDIWKGKKSALGLIIRDAGSLPPIFGNAYVWVYGIAIILAVILFFYLRKTKQGYEISVVGESIKTARYAGINDKAVIMRTAAFSGAICGLIGFLYVSAVNPTIAAATGGSYGFTAIIVAWLAQLNPLFMALISVLLTFISAGSIELVNGNVNLNSSIADIMIAIFLFCLLGSEFFLRYRLVFREKVSKAAGVKEG